MGTRGQDDLQGVACDGEAIYVAGNTGEAQTNGPDGVKIVRFGQDAKSPRCGVGFVARLTIDGKSVTHYAEIGAGTGIMTSVVATREAVYVSGYANEQLEPLIKDVPGLMRTYGLPRASETVTEGRSTGASKPGLHKHGAPFVLKLSKDLSRIEAGTYLEGWQQVWEKQRVIQTKPTWKSWPREYFWQPTTLNVTAGGDVVVTHDGGYDRENTPEDLAAAKQAKDPAKLLGRLRFYDVCDHVSRLSGDLSKRVWHQTIYAPETNQQAAAQLRDGWPKGHYSNPRTHRTKLDAAGTVYLAGWSASATSAEPYWTPYLWRLDGGTGRVVGKSYAYDPLAGEGNQRMNGTVADTAITALAVEPDGTVLAGLLSDGGNTVMGLSPKADLKTRFEGPVTGGDYGGGLVHWWSQLHRLDATKNEGIARTRIGRTAWLVEIVPLASKHVLAVGRCNGKFETTKDALQVAGVDENPVAFVRVYDGEMKMVHSSQIRGVVPFEAVAISPTRVAIVGRAAAKSEPLLLDKQAGQQEDGYLLIVEIGKP